MLSIFKKETIATEPVSNIKDLIHEGNDYFSDELILLGEKLTGNLFCAEKVVVDAHGVLTGNITSKTCTVSGEVNGDILSLDLLDIKANAVVRGNIQSAKVNIEPGAVINGYITVGEDIEALTKQWNKTKFSTDDYLTTRLNKELSGLNNIKQVASAPATKVEPGLVAAVTAKAAPKQEQQAQVAAKPLVAATSTQQEQQQVFESKPLVAAASANAPNQSEPEAQAAPAPKPLVAAAAPKKEEETANNSRWW